jgi:hypothetical protein
VNWRYALPSDAAKATITVTDAAGKVLYSKTATGDELAQARTTLRGTANSMAAGREVGEPYWISVVAEDANAKAITASHSLVTTITGVDLTYGEPALTTPSGVFAYSDIKRLMRQ